MSEETRPGVSTQDEETGGRRHCHSKTFLLAALFIIHEGIIAEMTLCHKLRRGPSGNREGGLSHFHYRPPVLVTISGCLDELYIKSGDGGRASKNQLRKCNGEESDGQRQAVQGVQRPLTHVWKQLLEQVEAAFI